MPPNRPMSGRLFFLFNIIDSSYQVTGFGVNTGKHNSYGTTFVQNFESRTTEKAYTTDQYRARLSAYENYLENLSAVVVAAENKVTSAETAESKAKSDLVTLEQDIKTAEQAVTDAENRVTSLTDQITRDEIAISNAQEALAQKKQAVAAAEKELVEAKAAVSSTN